MLVEPPAAEHVRVLVLDQVVVRARVQDGVPLLAHGACLDQPLAHDGAVVRDLVLVQLAIRNQKVGGHRPSFVYLLHNAV